MGKRIVASKPLVKRGSKKTSRKGGTRTKKADVRAHYTKPIRVQADYNAPYPDRVYYFQQIYSPNDVENPLKGTWDRANHLRAMGYDSGKPMLVKMSPQEFLDLNTIPNWKVSEYKVPDIKKAFKSGEWEERSMISEGPLMDINETGRIVGHEGRHRAMVLRELGHTEMPVLIYDRSKRDDDWRDHEPWMRAEVQALREARRR